MRALRRVSAAVAVCLSAAACATGASSERRAELREVAEAMTGTFSSAAQHAADAEGYHDIRLVMIPVWPERDDGPWLYVEQAIADRADKPYRQRVYRLRSEGPGAVASEVYTLPGDPLSVAGTWRDVPPLCCTKVRDLALREGCTVHLRRAADGAWEGGTEGTGCASELRGAKHATTEIRLEPGLLVAWDRGWDAAGAQVWGPSAGPYRFVRVSTAPPR